MKNLPRIYCDMDGVLCDFGAAIRKTTGMPKERWMQLDREAMWKPVLDNTKFWHTMPWNPQGRVMWNFIKKYNPHILSAYAPYDKNSRKGKMLWLQRNLKLTDASRIHLVRRSEKKVYANGNVLVDDYGRNVKEWKRNKGIPVKYKSANQAIADLRKIGYK